MIQWYKFFQLKIKKYKVQLWKWLKPTNEHLKCQKICNGYTVHGTQAFSADLLYFSCSFQWSVYKCSDSFKFKKIDTVRETWKNEFYFLKSILFLIWWNILDKNSQKFLHIPFPLLGDWLKINAKVINRETPEIDMVEGEGTELYNLVYVLRWRAKNVWGVLQISVRFKDDQLTLN